MFLLLLSANLADKEQESTTSQYNSDEHIAILVGALLAM